MIAAVDRPAIAHSELAVLCDVVPASEDAYFEDAAHVPSPASTAWEGPSCTSPPRYSPRLSHRETTVSSEHLDVGTPRRGRDEAVAYPLAVAFELLELGARLRAQRHRREHPDATEGEVDAVVRRWMRDRPGAEHGDSPGRQVHPGGDRPRA